MRARTTAIFALLLHWIVPAQALETNSLVLRLGEKAMIESGASQDARVHWFFDGKLLPGATNSWFSITNLQPEHQGRYSAVVEGSSGETVTNKIDLIVVWHARRVSRTAQTPWKTKPIFRDDADGNLHELDQRTNGFNLTKYGGWSEKLWEATYLETNRSLFLASDMRMARDGTVFVAGATPDSTIPVVVRISPAGIPDPSLLYHARELHDGWFRMYSKPAIAVDSGSNFYLQGFVTLAGETGEERVGESPFAFTKLDRDGKALWWRRPAELATAVPPEAWSIDSSNNLYIATRLAGSIMTAKFDPDGKLLWSTNFSYFGRNFGAVYSVLVDAEDNVLVSASLPSGAPWDGQLTIQYSSGGQLNWIVWHPDTTTYVRPVLALDRESNFYSAGQGLITKYDKSGKKIWHLSDPISEWLDFIGVHHDGGILIRDREGQAVEYEQSKPHAAQPVATSWTAAQRLFEGGELRLEAEVSGGEPVSYQWLLNDAPIPNETNRTLNFSAMTTSQSGFYSLYIANAHGVAVTERIAVVVSPMPGPFSLALFRAETNVTQVHGVGPYQTIDVPLEIRGEPMRWYEIQSSGNFQDWSGRPYVDYVRADTNGIARALVKRDPAPLTGARFYRARTYP